ncbi:MAG: ATP-dependent RecD-like DNA helicase [Flavobacteriaceae bacterium]|jgi:hypothetical protein|nr:MAG: ATP-dependent RecD-like DNA helicase [Flavobacteriaceae bacterium]|tara:strand:- start:2751 stop:3902 length:1152 start_codon:yes stop_codon:yes gene_type:complete
MTKFKPTPENKHRLLTSSHIVDNNRFPEHPLFEKGYSASLNGFSGVAEFSTFPLRQLFVNKHNRFPCEWDTCFISLEDITQYVDENNAAVISTHYCKNGKDIEKCVLFLGGEECVYVYFYRISFRSGQIKYGVSLLFTKKTKAVDKIITDFIKMVIPEEEKKKIGRLNILIQTSDGFELEEKEIKNPEIDFSTNYNKDFEPINNLIVEKLSEDKSKGLVLLHGEPGTGKTTYIRYLINNVEKRIIYVPPNMASSLASPELIKFLIENSNSILVIEDAENVLMKRVGNSTQATANILNLTDGLLSDCINTQVVATFNTNVLNIDDALLRKGRLISIYKFEKLSNERVEKLCINLGVENDGSYKLSDIYNSNEKSFTKNQSQIGF